MDDGIKWFGGDWRVELVEGGVDFVKGVVEWDGIWWWKG